MKVKTIDLQHKKLIELLNKMYDGLREQRGKEVLGGILTELVTYTQSHFSTEERLMTTHKFPGLESHKLEHHMLVKKVSDFQRDFQEGRTSVTIDVMNFLREWLTSHIQGTDKQYSSFFVDRGVN